MRVINCTNCKNYTETDVGIDVKLFERSLRLLWGLGSKPPCVFDPPYLGLYQDDPSLAYGSPRI